LKTIKKIEFYFKIVGDVFRRDRLVQEWVPEMVLNA